MIGREKYSKKDKKRLFRKLLLLFFLAALFLLNLVMISVQRSEERKQLEEYQKQMDTKEDESLFYEVCTETVVPNFGTEDISTEGY